MARKHCIRAARVWMLLKLLVRKAPRDAQYHPGD
jgi:hypothetical protein